MSQDRLLKPEERSVYLETSFGRHQIDITSKLKAQDTRTKELVLKDVGEWLEGYTGKHIPNWNKMIEALKQGKMPEE